MIAKKRDKIKIESENRILTLLITLMDSLKSNNKIIEIGVTIKIEEIESDLIANEHFCKEIEIGMLDKNDRYEILKIHT